MHKKLDELQSLLSSPAEKNRKSYVARRDNGNAHGGLNVTRGR